MALERYAEREVRLERELDQVRRTIGLVTPGGTTRVPAQVIAFFPMENRLTIGAGADAGIRPGLPVVAAQGFVGIVQTVEPKRSQVLLVTSPALKIGAMIDRAVPVPGIMRGENPERLILEVVENVPIASGERVVTSGYSEHIPRGLPLGTVVEAARDPDFGARRAYIFPNVRTGLLREVMVLK